ncbi:hypothetical protein GCM10010329_53510 [Streptomyces spiroverticillatus]|uniref:Exo-alpha-sialidase n=1 Tax=Streptomyces finlayi TaxID=67296 RepID=A0A918X231_9ACTN|nr:hypothetical protein [Streptomyces finlayi]GHA23407.1 hypothetical protein GCM10010329_53510 [Streptomyces spiroverticillatus]GHD04795.1 hypothetical protein GCM10010334_54430 [Streptomyces finlayi]
MNRKHTWRGALRGAITLTLALTGALALTPAAGAAPSAATTTTTATCASDPLAQGQRGGAAGDLVSVPRADGRVEQFQTFYDPTSMSGLPFVWQRSQSAPGAAYGTWVRVGASTVGPKLYGVTGIENAAGGIELLWSTYGTFCHSARPASASGWTAATGFGLQPAAYHGGVTLHRRPDGTVLAISSSNAAGRAAESRALYASDAAAGTWQPVAPAGTVPEAGVGLGQPEVIGETPDHRIKVKAREWNRDRYWTLTESAPDTGVPSGGWNAQWTLCTTSACT